MEIKVERDALVDAISWVSRTLPLRPTNAALRNVLLSVDTSSTKPLVFTTFDGDSLSDIHINADIDEPGKVLISGQLLTTVARILPTAPVTITIDENSATIRCGRAEFQLPVAAASAFPQLPAMPAACGSIPGATLATAISQVAVAAGKSLSRADLLGVFVEFHDGHLRFVATDRHRLSLRDMGWSPAAKGEGQNALVPARAFSDISRALASAESVTVHYDLASGENKYIGFEANDRRAITQLMGERFNEYEKIIPTETATTVRFDTSELLDAAKRVSTLAANRTATVNNIRLEFANNTIELSASGEHSSAREALDCVIDGDAVDFIVFNAEYLIDGLSSVNAPVAQLSMTDSRKLAMLQGASAQDAEVIDNFKYLIAPSRL